MADSPLQILEDFRAALEKAVVVYEGTNMPAPADAADEPEGKLVVKITDTLRRRTIARIDAVLDAALADEPTGQAALDDAFESGRDHGERSTDGFHVAITKAAQAIRMLKFDEAKTRARTAIALLEEAAKLVEGLAATNPVPDAEGDAIEQGEHRLVAKTLHPDGTITEDLPAIIKTDGWFMRATPPHDTFVGVILDALEELADDVAEPIVTTQVWLDVEGDDTIVVGMHYRPWWLAEDDRSLKMRSTFMLEAWAALEQNDPGAATVASDAFKRSVREMAESERQAACE